MLFLVFSMISAQEKANIRVSGACGMCKEKIETAAKAITGVMDAVYSLDKHELRCSFDAKIVNPSQIGSVIASIGYDNEYYKSDEDTYLGLAYCCQYKTTEQGDHIIDQNAILLKNKVKISRFLRGTITETDNNQQKVPLIGATISWLNAPSGTTTDIEGNFEIGRISSTNYLVVSFVGMQSDTIDVSQTNIIEHDMTSNLTMDEVVISHRKNTTEISFVKPIQTLSITEEELCKAACCSLSESFETSPSIDVSFTDAVTGTRQIQMLGLAGRYVQITRELIPSIRSLGVVQGLSLTPGAWIESIQLSKGTGSVVNGFESMTGQINLELRKPNKKDQLFLNFYGNQAGRFEGNLFLREKLNENISTGILIHGASRQKAVDNNEDLFLDNPLGENFIGINRWSYQNKNGWQAQAAVKWSLIESRGGQNISNVFDPVLLSSLWKSNISASKYEYWGKIGKLLDEERNRSIGFQFMYVDHQTDHVYGPKIYDNKHRSIYANLIFQSDVWSKKHMIKMGGSYLLDDIVEQLNFEENISLTDYMRLEKVPGAFAEYTFLPNEKFTLVAGIRTDYHSVYKLQITPRIHAKYAITENSVVRLMGGSGWRSPNIFSDNPEIFANRRAFRIIANNENTPFGVGLEKSWNIGANLTQKLNIGNKQATLALDYYFTHFDNQVLVDRGYYVNTSDPLIIYDQDGASRGHSFQIQLDVNPFSKLDIRVAYRNNRNTAKYSDGMRAVPFLPQYRAFINLAYEAPKGWHFDYTFNWRGAQDLPSTEAWPIAEQLGNQSPDYFLSNAQIRKLFNEQFEIYSGVENMFNFTQANPIVGVENPHEGLFDATMIWGPIFGRNIYAGIRYRI